jgi:hypothetical protein
MKRAKTVKTAAAKGRNVADFRMMHDPTFYTPARIKEALASLGDAWEYEREFANRAKISMVVLSRSRNQFPDYIVQVSVRNNSKYVWCGTKQLAKRLRSIE